MEPPVTDETQPKNLSPAAQRALAEAQERRRLAQVAAKASEIDGPAGVEPTRFGDWERKGIAYDF
jgi:hypothetical protein